MVVARDGKGIGSGIGGPMWGWKMVLNPLPLYVSVKSASAPKLGPDRGSPVPTESEDAG